MYLILFFYILTCLSLTLGEFGQIPFGKADFSVSITDGLLLILLSIFLIWNLGIKKHIFLPIRFRLLGAFWFISLLSLLISWDFSGLAYFFRFIAYSSISLIIFYLYKVKIFSVKEFTKLIVGTSVVLSTMGFLQLIFFPDLTPLIDLGYDPHKNRLVSTFLDPNFLGTFLSFSFAMLLSELIEKKAKTFTEYIKTYKWQLLSSLIICLAIILTLSRSAYLIFIISSGIILLAKKWQLSIISLALLILIFFLNPTLNERIQGGINIDDSAIQRFYSWDKGLQIFSENPILGIGFNNLRNYGKSNNLITIDSEDGGNSGAGIDSSLIFVLATTGIIGFLSFTFFLAKIISDSFSTLLQNSRFYNLNLYLLKISSKLKTYPIFSKWKHSEYEIVKSFKQNSLSLIIVATTFGLIINSFFINSLFFPPIMFIWFSLIGAFYGLGEGEGSS